MIERLSAHTLSQFRRLEELEVLCGKQQTTIKHLNAYRYSIARMCDDPSLNGE